MRTTVTLDDDVVREIRRHMAERGSGFKQTMNELLRRGLRARDEPIGYTLPTFSSGARPGVDLDRALALVAALDDDESMRKLELRK